MLSEWLKQLCQMMPGVQSAIVVDSLDAEAAHSAAATWPDASLDSTIFFTMLPLLKAQKGPVVTLDESGEQASIRIAYPLHIEAHFNGAVLLDVAAQAKQQAVLLQLLAWAERWLVLMFATLDSKSATAQLGTEASHDRPDGSELFAQVRGVLDAPNFVAAGMQVVNALVKKGFERVALAGIRNGEAELITLSHTANFDARSNLVKQLCQRIQEQFEGLKDDISEEAQTSALVVSKSADEHAIGLYFEGRALSTEEREQADLLVSLLSLKAESGQNLLQRSRSQLSKHYRRWRQGNFGRPAWFALLFGLVLCTTWFVESTYRIRVPANLEANMQRAVVAPFDAYIEASYRRAGDAVVAGDVLAELDDKPLQLELSRLQNQQDEYRKQYRMELAGLSHAKSRIIKSQIAQAEAQIQLLQERLKRARLLAPIDGLIVQGDLSRALGAPVEQGQVLFEVAPLDMFRVVLELNEQDMPYVSVGQTGELRLKAYPDQSIPIVIEKVATMYQQDEGRLWYRTEARIDKQGLDLRPGMEGVAKVEVGEASLLWIATHPMLDWLRLRLWSWSL